MFRRPGCKGSDRWSVNATGIDEAIAARLAQDPAEFERVMREITGRDDIKITRWDYLASHTVSVGPCCVIGVLNRLLECSRRSAWPRRSAKAAASSRAMLHTRMGPAVARD
jgi:hypothetical protein